MKNTFIINIILIKLFIFLDCINDSASSQLLIRIIVISSFYILIFNLINVKSSIYYNLLTIFIISYSYSINNSFIRN